jgi:hypothetical protein
MGLQAGAEWRLRALLQEQEKLPGEARAKVAVGKALDRSTILRQKAL